MLKRKNPRKTGYKMGRRIVTVGCMCQPLKCTKDCFMGHEEREPWRPEFCFNKEGLVILGKKTSVSKQSPHCTYSHAFSTNGQKTILHCRLKHQSLASPTIHFFIPAFLIYTLRKCKLEISPC